MRIAAIAAACCLALSSAAQADGYGTTSGRSRDGWNLDFDEPSTIRLWRDGDFANPQMLYQEPCEFRQVHPALAHPHADAYGALVCAASGHSPLAGTVYEMRPVKNSVCERGDPEFRLTCVSGCGRAPSVMLSGYWEC